ncbi:sigma-70 family RNA polymerase sigma factor [Amycolatopsis sp. H20-H5]|uniref:sigma-70 family RNA polymerase sigma factor n=1 Tax=Amycolatopsis sp. H20-H5 TaxID=3046309 RepID=UPI002DBD7B93|nr:sigma-70 family RNA polymerase sigma factor [Amycolatopsis sp. H20-H5]MEC3979897.1 sigma-70 family RNA polymerase sigma factor [Amycolatopsis sp. H20-H5]
MNLPSSEKNPDSGAFFVRPAPAHIADPGVFDAARTAFAWLVTGPHPVALDCRTIAGLPARLVPLDELGTLLLPRGSAAPAQDAAWAALITRSRAEGGTWTVACVGLALPLLLRVAATLTRQFRGEVHDIHAAVLTGFLAGLTTVDLDRRAIVWRLRWAAYRAGHTALREALDATPPVADLTHHTAPPHQSSGHPDFALLAAVDAGAITAAEAALIGDTRLGELSLAAAAQARGQTYKATQQARHRAETRLAAHLAATGTTDVGDTAAHAPSQRRTSRAPAVTPPSGTRRDRVRGVTRRTSAWTDKQRRPVSPRTRKSGVSERGPHLPAHSPRPSSTRPVSRPDPTQEASSCD